MATKPLTREGIRELVDAHEGVARSVRGARGRQPLTPPTLPLGAPPGGAFDQLADQIDARLGKGTGAHIADTARLTDLLDVLSRGTVEDEIHRLEMLPEKSLASIPLPAAFRDQFKEQGAVRLAQVRDYTPAEVEAVLSSLDLIEKAFPLLVPQVRLQHVPGERERIRAIGERMREGRPTAGAPGPLTSERISTILATVSELAPSSQKVQDVLGTPSVYKYQDAPVEKAFGKKVMKSLAQRGEDPQLFLVDLVRIRIIAALLRSAGSVAESLGLMQALASPEAWRNPYRSPEESHAQAETRAAGVEEFQEVQRRIDPASEAAVREMLPEIEGALTPWKVVGRPKPRR